MTEVKSDFFLKEKKAALHEEKLVPPVIDCVLILSVLQQIHSLPGNLCDFSTNAKPSFQGRLVREFY